jgi:cytochrome c6
MLHSPLNVCRALSRRMGGAFASGFALSAILLVGGTPLVSNADASGAQAKMELGRKIFTQMAVPQCGVCHTLADAGTNGTIGAKLEELKPDAARVAKAVRDGVGVMPPYRDTLTEEQIQAVAYYVSRAAAGLKE